MRHLLGGRAGGFFIPYRHAAAVVPLGYPALEPLLAAALPAMEDLLRRVDAFGPALSAMRGPPPMPRWDQDWFPRLDGAALYAMVRLSRPGRIVEIGSGHSTRFMAQAVRDGGFSCRITCIDPAPRADLGRLDVDLRRRLLQPDDADLATRLEPGDILFVDSSHVAMPGSDVDLVLTRLLPLLKAGVLVQFHDVFLPDPYPISWAWRGYSEQIPIACLVLAGGWTVRFASHYVATRHPTLFKESAVASLPLVAGAFETSLWLERQATEVQRV
jgi:predicted O-methyltransferase YrrM